MIGHVQYLMGLARGKLSNEEGETKCDAKPFSNKDNVHNELDTISSQHEMGYTKPEITLSTLADLKISEDEEAYNMRHPRRGMAIIFNHKDFEPPLGLTQRKGTDRDKENLCNVLQQLDFEIHVYDDLNYKEVERTLFSISADDSHKNADCLLIVVLTHGEEGILYAKDHPYRTEKIWAPFSDMECPSLIGKPKLFFIQACQGDRLDEGVTLMKRISSTESDSDKSHSTKTPTHPDFLVVYSTIEGFYSWRNVDRGSWFIQALCQVLSNQWNEGRDILSCMTLMSRKIAFDFQSNVPTNRVMHEKKQVPCVNSTLTKDLIFTPK